MPETVSGSPVLNLDSTQKTKHHESEVWAQARVIERAKQLLKLDKSQIKIPEQIYANAWGPVKKSIQENYLARRNYYLSQLANGKLPYLSSDADGTCTFKTVQKVENSRSIGSLQDKYYLRLLLAAYKKIGGYFEVNTARTGAFPGPSLVGTEGPKFKDDKGNWVNPRSPNEISGLLHEFGIHDIDTPESKSLFDFLIINGLSAAVKHDPRVGTLQIAPQAIKYARFIEKLNQIKLPDAPDGFLSKIEEAVSDSKKAKPLKVLEYKSVPKVFIDHPEFKTEDFFRYISLVEKHRDEQSTDAEFFNKLNASGIKLPLPYYDPQNPPATEIELTNKLRQGSLTCLNPHNFDSDNIVRDDKKVEFYKILSKFARSPEAQEWAEKELGIPKGTNLFTVNGYDVSHVDFENFEKQYKDLAHLFGELKDKNIKPANKDHIIINVLDNLQPYTEIAPNTSKADVFDIEKLTKENKYFVIGAGDSPGSDAALLAQALLLGGAGFIVRGLMGETQVLEKMVELLATKPNQAHEFALTKIANSHDGKAQYQMNSNGDIKTVKGWVDFFKQHYSSKILKCSNIHENNAFNAAIFSEFFAGDNNFSMELNPNQDWVKTVLENTCRQSLVTPISEAGEKALQGQVYEKSLLDKFPFIKSIPVIGKALDPLHAGETFNNLLGIVSKALIGAAPVGIIADYLGFSSLGYLAKLTQRVAYGVNNIVSGVSRGLYLSSHKFYWQFIGEMLGLTSTFFEQTNTFGRILRALSNLNLVGRANELAMRDNYNLAKFVDEESVKAEFSKNPNAVPYINKRQVASKLTTETMSEIDNWSNNYFGGVLGKIPGGKHLVATLAQFKQGVKLAWDFVRIPEIREHALSNLIGFKPTGRMKMSMNSGKPYAEAFEANTYAFAGMATFGTALLATISGFIPGTGFVQKALTNLANMIPALGIVTAGKLVHQDQAGDPRLFTDVAKNQQNHSPEKSGWFQTVAGWMIALTGTCQHTAIGAELYNLANGFYLEGIREQLKVGVDDSAVNKLTRQGQYYKLRPQPKLAPGREIAKKMAA